MEWKVVQDAPMYEVSSDGVFRHRSNSTIKKRYINKRGYEYVTLYSDKKSKKTFQAHRLIAKAFLGESQLTVNHKNGIKHDNRVENLEYVTSKENSRHAYWDLDVGPHGEKHHNAKLTEASVAKIWELKDAGLNAYQIAPLIGCTRANICYILRGKAWARVSAKLGRITLPTT